MVIRFGQEIVAPQIQGADDGIGVVQAGGENNRAVKPAPQPLAEVHSVDVRQKDVQQDHIEFLPHPCQSVLPRGGADHLEIGLCLQKAAGGLPDDRVILHHQNADHDFHLPFCGCLCYTK